MGVHIFAFRRMAAIVGLGIAGCLMQAGSAAADDLKVIQDRGSARAVVANEEPYGYINSAGEAAGIGPDVAVAVMAKLGVENIGWTVVPFDGLIPGVKANRFDFSAAEQSILPRRCEQVLFSTPNSSYGLAVLVKAGNPKEITSYEDLAKSGIRLAQVAGASDSLSKAYNLPESQRVYIQSNVDAVAAILADRADAYIATELTLVNLTRMNAEVEIAGIEGDPVIDGKPFRYFGGFTFRPEDKEFHAAFNAALEEFKATDEYEEILTSYGLSKNSVEAARAASTEKLCAGE